MNYLHTKNIVHRDLKPDNILYKPFTGDIQWDKLSIKVIDFGFAKEATEKTLDEFVGTPFYIAPEILNKQKYGF